MTVPYFYSKNHTEIQADSHEPSAKKSVVMRTPADHSQVWNCKENGKHYQGKSSNLQCNSELCLCTNHLGVWPLQHDWLLTSANRTGSTRHVTISTSLWVECSGHWTQIFAHINLTLTLNPTIDVHLKSKLSRLGTKKKKKKSTALRTLGNIHLYFEQKKGGGGIGQHQPAERCSKYGDKTCTSKMLLRITLHFYLPKIARLLSSNSHL